MCKQLSNFIFSFTTIILLILVSISTINQPKEICSICLRSKFPIISKYKKVNWDNESVTIPLEDLQDLVSEIKSFRKDHDRQCR